MRLHWVFIFLLSSSAISAFAEDDCEQAIYQSYVGYRLALNKSASFEDTKHYFNYDQFLKSAEIQLKEESILKRFFINDQDIEREAIEDIERLNRVRRTSVGVGSYFAVCNEGKGELFMKSVSADARYKSTSLVYKKVDEKWLISNPQLFNYSKILNENIVPDEMPDRFVSVYKNFLTDELMGCLSKLDGSDLYYDDYDKFSETVTACYETNDAKVIDD